MTMYMMVCLNPNLLIFVPQAIIIGVIARNYYSKASRDARKSSGGKSSRRSENGGAGNSNNNNHSSISNSRPLKPSQFKPDSIHYRKNMQFIQNTMGMYCDAYEGLRMVNTKIDWSDESQTALVLQLTVLSAVLVGVSYWMIPWNLVFLLIGLGAFLANTAIARASQALMAQYLDTNMDVVRTKIQRLFGSDDASGSNANGSENHSTIVIECVENQRWWAGLNWIPHTLRTERPPWSSLDGTVASKCKEEVSDPSEAVHMGLASAMADSSERLPSDLSTLHWKWTPNSHWALDVAWAASATPKNGPAAQVDEEGWVYSDHNWNFSKKKNALLTRRRRWVRTALLADPPKE